MKGKKILVVADGSNERIHHLCDFLRNEKYQVAARKIESKQTFYFRGKTLPDLIIISLEESGTEQTIAKINNLRQEPFAEIPICFLSEQAEPLRTARRVWAKNPANLFIQVNTDIAEIAEKIKRFPALKIKTPKPAAPNKISSIQKRLNELEENFRETLVKARIVWWEWNGKTTEMSFSDNFSEVYGSIKIKNSADCLSLIYLEDQENYLSILEKAIANHSPYQAEYRVVRPDNGQIIWIEENAAPFFDRQGKLQKIVGITKDITKRKLSEIALNESEERFKAQYKNSSVPVYIWKSVGQDFILTDFNDYARKKFSRKLSLQLGKSVREIFKNAPGVLRSMRKCSDKKKTVKFETSYQFPDEKQPRHLVFNSICIEPDLVMLYTDDVTEYRKTIDSLRISENRFQMVSLATHDVLWEWDLVTNSFWWNENLQNVFGYSVEQFQNDDINGWADCLHSSDKKRVMAELKEVLRSDKSYWTGEYLFRHKEGFYAYVLNKAYIERNKKGKALKMMGAMSDITNRKKTEKELLESRERLSLAQQVGKIGSFDWNLRTGKIITSRQMERIYGAIDNFGGTYRNWLDFIHSEDLKRVETDLRKLLIEGSLTNDFRIITTAGELRWIQSQMKVFYDYTGIPQRIIGVNMDATERKLAEDALQDSQERLRQSQKLESVGRLAGGIAHDFNNMLTAINGYSDLILRTLDEDSSLRRQVSEIKKAGERSAELTRQLLAFSRQQVLQTKLVDLNQVITDMSQLLCRLIGEDIELQTQFSAENCLIEVDPGQLSQVIMNLVVNARDAMPDGGKLTIQTKCFFADEEFVKRNLPMIIGHYAVLSVADTGIGIDEQTKKYIFDPFFTTKKNSGGTGLGLATVYGIVKQFEGFIWVESEEGHGTKFDVYLPLSESQEIVARPEKAVDSLASGAETILLVEDEESVRNLTQQILEMYDYKVICAADGIAAIELCKKLKPKIDLLMTDVVMPQMNGHKLSENIKKIYPTIRVLYTSGYTNEKSFMDKLPDGEKNYIQKPFSPDSLARKIREILDSTE